MLLVWGVFYFDCKFLKEEMISFSKYLNTENME